MTEHGQNPENGGDAGGRGMTFQCIYFNFYKNPTSQNQHIINQLKTSLFKT